MRSRILHGFKGRLNPKAIISCLFIAAFMIICPLTLQAQSTTNSVFDENYNLISRFSADLDQDIISYSNMDDTVDKSISQRVSEVINEYQSKLRLLQSHPEVSSRSLEMEINLAHSKAKAVGKLAWIYYYNITEITDKTSCSTLLSLYEGYKSEIDKGTDYAVVDSDSDRINYSMNRDVYREKIRNLALPEDSGYVDLIISHAVDTLENIYDSDLLAGQLTVVYNTTKQELLMQRGKDELASQLQSIFAVVKPGESFNDSGLIEMLNYETKNAESITELNTGMKETLRKFLSASEDEYYTYIFINNLRSEISSLATKASKSDKIGQFSSLFSNYGINFKRAYAKDRVAELIFKNSDKTDEELKSIEALFNSNGGRIDRCESQAEMELELFRAQHRKNLWLSYSGALNSLRIIMGSYDSSTFEARIKSTYTNSAGEINEISSGNHQERFEETVSSANQKFSLILDECKAERFLEDNSSIIKKPKDELIPSDEAALKVALSDYIYLDASVQKMLSSQAASIAEKYKSVISQKVRNLYPDDAFYQELCEKIYQEISSTQTDNIADFYNSANISFKKAQAIQAITLYYRDITAAEEYSSLTAQEKKEMTDACRKLSEDLISASLSTINSILSQSVENAKLTLDRTAQYARVRISARGSKNANVQQLLTQTKADILDSTNKNEMTTMADDAIFKIYRYLTVDQINLLTDKTTDEIQTMEFLEAGEKAAFGESAEALRSSLGAEAGLAKNITVLTFVWENFSENLEQIANSANEIDTERGRIHYSTLADKSLEATKIEIRGMTKLSDERITEILSSLSGICDNFKVKLTERKTSKEIKTAYEAATAELEAVKLAAEAENLNNYKTTVEAELEALKELKPNYSDESFNQILSIIDAAKSKLSACTSIAECSAVLASAKNEMSDVNDLLDDARDAAIAKLDTLISNCKSEPLLYSADNLDRISELYQSAIEAIKAFKNISDIIALNEQLEKSISLIGEIPRDRVYSSKDATAITDKDVKYPENYDFSKGYWASISSPGAIASNALFAVRPASIDKDIQTLIRKAARKNTLKVYGSPNDDQLKALKKCVISLAIDARLSVVSSDANAYTLQLLLPNELANEKVLGIVFTDDQGNVEFYNVQQNGLLLTTTLPHLSQYYIVTESVADLTGLIIFLIILIVFEIVALCFFIYLRRNRKRKEIYMLPDSFMYGINPVFAYSALRVVPQNGVGLTLLLSVSALALGCGIAILARTELKMLKKQDKENPKENTPKKEQKLLSKKDTPLLKEKTYMLESKKMQPVYCAVGAEADIEATKVFVSKEDAPEKSESGILGDLAIRKAEINLDVIAKKFSTGELVTPETLKRKGLIHPKTDHVKILARGKLTKPLLVEAHDFSRTAEEMLKAVGGEAIRIK